MQHNNKANQIDTNVCMNNIFSYVVWLVEKEKVKVKINQAKDWIF